MKIKKIQIKKDSLFLLTLGVMLSFSLSYAITSTTEFTQSPLQMLLNLFVIMVAIRVIFTNKYTIIVSSAMVVVFVIILSINLIISDTPIIHEIVYFILEILLYLNGIIPHRLAFETTLILLLNILISFFVFVFSHLWFNFFILFIGSITLFAVVLTSGFFNSNIAFYVFIISIVSYLIKYLSDKNNESKSKYIFYAIPISIFSFGIASFIPTPQDGFSENLADNLISRPFNFINILLHDTFRPKYFSLAQTGFGGGNSRRLGGNVTTNYNVVMRIESDSPIIYLTGAIMDTYTGYSWVNNFTENYKLYFGDLNLELLEKRTSMINFFSTTDFRDIGLQNNLYFDFFNFNPNNLQNIIEKREDLDTLLYYLDLDLDLDNIYHFTALREMFLNPPIQENILTIDTLEQSSFTVFYNGLITSYNHDMYGNNFLINENGTITSQNLIPRNTRYSTTYAFFNDIVNTSILKNMSYDGILSDVLASLENYTILFPSNFPFSEEMISYSYLLENHLIPRANFIREIYTELPEHFPQRVIDLANYVTRYADNDYERARMLESFLRQFEYTLTPGSVPANRDFVDYFLFDVMRGYCTYYASAFATMARALGMPTRYVEGFIAINNNTEEYIYIRNRQGHAWAEVYFEGFGWYRFDPTPPSETFGAIFSSDIINPLNIEWDLDWDTSLMWWEDEAYFLMQTSTTFNNLAEQNNDEINFEQPQVNNETRIAVQNIITLSILTVFGLLSAIITSRFFYINNKKTSIVKKSNNDAVIIYFIEIMKCLSFFNYEKREEETALEFSKRISDIIFEIDGNKFTMFDITNIFLKAKYSNHKITNEEKKLVQIALKQMNNFTKNYVGNYKYFVVKYVFASI